MYDSNPLKHLSKMMLCFCGEANNFHSGQRLGKKNTMMTRTSVSSITVNNTVALGDEVPSKLKTKGRWLSDCMSKYPCMRYWTCRVITAPGEHARLIVSMCVWMCCKALWTVSGLEKHYRTAGQFTIHVFSDELKWTHLKYMYIFHVREEIISLCSFMLLHFRWFSVYSLFKSQTDMKRSARIHLLLEV